MIIVIGRGHSGTRAISRTLAESGFHMGVLSNTYDHTPPELESFYKAIALYSRLVPPGAYSWSFHRANAEEPPDAFKETVSSYTKSAKDGWKLPETLLALPWIVKLFPDAHYIHWERNPRTNVLKHHLTDDLHIFGVAHPPPHTVFDRGDVAKRVRSWIYQSELVRACPKPAKWLRVRFEDFVLKQDQTLATLSDFLGRKLVRIPVDTEAANRVPSSSLRLESYLRRIGSDYA
jgi:Sulfotransferase family